MAIAAATIFEVRTTGSDTNGGGFVAGASGTDYSQQTSAQYTGTDLAVDATTNTIVRSSSHSFVSTDVGNLMQITAGTGFTTGFYQIVSISSGAATLDRSPGATSITGGTYAVGGALATIGKANGAIVAGNTVYVKATGTYSVSTGTTVSVTGTAGNSVAFLGYNSTRGDAGQVTIQGTANITIFTLSGTLIRFANFLVDSNSNGAGVLVSGTQIFVSNVKVQKFTTVGINATGTGVQIFNCIATLGTAAASAGLKSNSAGGVYLQCCSAFVNACPGFVASGLTIFDRCIANGNTGASSDGFQLSTSGTSVVMSNCVSYGNGRDGARGTAAGSFNSALIRNCAFVNNAGFGMNSSATAWAFASDLLNYNAFYNNTSGARNSVPTGASDVTLTGDPFTNGSSGIFTLIGTGGGAQCSNAGFPGTSQYGGTGYSDIGVLRHQDPASTIDIVGGDFPFVG